MTLPFSPDEHGLRGVSLDLYLRQIFASLPPETIKQLHQQIHDEALRKELVYYHEGKIEAINVMMRPLAMFSEQLNYFHYVSQTLLGALKRMPELYLKDFQVREVVPLAAVLETAAFSPGGAVVLLGSEGGAGMPLGFVV